MKYKTGTPNSVKALKETITTSSPVGLPTLFYKYKYNKGLRSETGQPLDKNDE